jgi:hypothetical protein
MVPGGNTETIAFFMGYIHLAVDTARAREVYDGSDNSGRPQGYVPEQPNYVAAHAPIELESAPIRAGLLATPPLRFDDFEFADKKLLPDPVLPTFSFSLPTVKFLDVVANITGGIGRDQVSQPDPEDVVVTIRYGTGGGSVVQIDQRNSLQDNDQIGAVLDDDQIGPVTHAQIAALHPVDVPAVLHEMQRQVEAKIGPDIVLPTDGDARALAELVKERHEAAAAKGEPANPVEPGVYIDGVKQPAGFKHELPELPELREEPEVDNDLDDGDKVGLSADTGSNEAFNAGSISDLGEATFSMIVIGDYFKTNAIVQANVYQDNDKVEVAGAESVRDLVTGENDAKNIAELVIDDPAVPVVGHFFRNLKWNVDMVEGDLFDVSVLTQKNVIRDNDVTCQAEFAQFYELRTGDNQQVNVAGLKTWAEYDLIIIGGDYHGGNWIFQTNVLIDDDLLMIASDRPDTASQSISSGENTLLNDAAIRDVGGHSFREITDEALDLVRGLEGGFLDPATAFQVPGHGDNEISVLFVTGSYYDLNVISQLNIVVDLDGVIQILGEGDRGDPNATQSASTGGNVLINVASILDLGPVTDYQYLGGDAYEDAILVQTNIVNGDEEQDTVRIRDTDTLVSEIIAFTDDDDRRECEPTIVPVSTADDHNDGVGGVLH